MSRHHLTSNTQRPVLGRGDIEARLAEEVERALRYGRVFSMLLVETGALNRAQEHAVHSAAQDAVRRVDIVGTLDAQTVLLLFPETAKQAEIPATRALSAISRQAPAARGGLVKCPHSGTDTATLLTNARAAARRAEAGRFDIAATTAERFRVEQIDNDIVAAAPKTKQLFALVRNLSKTDLSVLISGETGVGKEVVAHALHDWSARRAGPFLAVNCAAIPGSLLESELFGHVKGAFSGAQSAKPGLIESASGGTLFLDEISEAEPQTQAKLLRVLETRETRPVGATVSTRVDVRFISATNRELERAIAAGRFRADLFYRLGTARIVVPPLRERTADILPLFAAFLDAAREEMGRSPLTLSEGAAARIGAHLWPGNVRELKNLTAYLAAIEAGPVVSAGAVVFANEAGREPSDGAAIQQEAAPTPSVTAFRNIKDEIRELEALRMRQALTAAGGNRTRAAALIGMPLRTFVTKVKAYDLGAHRGDGAVDDRGTGG